MDRRTPWITASGAASAACCCTVVLLITTACTKSDPGEPAWKALSYNVFYEQRDFSAVLEVIENVDPDVVCLQELTRDFSDQFVTRLGKRYGHRRFEARNGTHGIGVASHHPLSGVVLLRLEPLQMPALRSVVAKGCERLVIVCVHLWPWIAGREPDEGLLEHARKNVRLRVEQVRTLIRRLESERLPVLLLGDFNESESFPAMRLLRDAGFTMACDAPAVQV